MAFAMTARHGRDALEHDRRQLMATCGRVRCGRESYHSSCPDDFRVDYQLA